MDNALFDLSGRTALITGSTRGLGRAFAEGLAAAGAKVVLNGTDPERVAIAVKEVSALGHQADGVAFDVKDEAAIVATFERFDSNGVAIDILVNNAGIQWRKPMVELPTVEWQRVIDTNLTSAFVIGREHGCDNAANLLGRFARAVYNLGYALTDCAVMIHLGVTQILEGCELEFKHCLLGAEAAAFNLTQNFGNSFLFHFELL